MIFMNAPPSFIGIKSRLYHSTGNGRGKDIIITDDVNDSDDFEGPCLCKRARHLLTTE